MSGGLAALLDDIAAMAKAAASSIDDVGAMAGKATVKAVGAAVDDAAVTPRFVSGFSPARELPMIWKITLGSLRNKLILILPLALLLSQFLPILLTPLLMIGGAYLSFEGVEKLWETLRGVHEEEAPAAAGAESAQEFEKTMVSGAIRTDLILSSEIMVISLGEVADEGIWLRLGSLILVALVMTVGVYGMVALIVKADDVGLALTKHDSTVAKRIGNALVKGMPRFLAVLSFVGMIAMLWVGGHILLTGTDTLGWHAPYGFVHHIEQLVHDATGPLGGVLGWIVNTAFSAVAGIIAGAILVGIAHLIPRSSRTAAHTPEGERTQDQHL